MGGKHPGPPSTKENGIIPLVSELEAVTITAEEIRSVYVVTSLFNPSKYSRRYILYEKFVKHMKESGVTLFTAECVFNDGDEYHITRPGVKEHLQLIGRDVMWIKENLLNLLSERLPSNWRYIIWLDCDIEFERKDWVRLLLATFKRYKFDMIQMFECAKFLGPEGETLRNDYSFAYHVQHSLPIDRRQYETYYPHPGYGFCFPRRLWRAMGGLLERAVAGSADLHMAFATIGRASETVPQAAAEGYHRLVAGWEANLLKHMRKGNVGYLPVNVTHFWHGSRENRKYVDRWEIVVQRKFDPSVNLQKDRSGVLYFTGECGDIREAIKEYFASRKEDEMVNTDHEHEVVPVFDPLKLASVSLPQEPVYNAAYAGVVTLSRHE